jgi:hypothetical protein
MECTRITMALTLAAGAFLYFSDHDTLDRHWRLALGLCVGALIVALSKLPTPAAPVHASLTPVHLPAHAGVH